MEILKKLIKLIATETHRGNFIPLLILIALSYYFLFPLYAKYEDAVSTNTQTDTEIAIDVYELRKELSELREKVESDFKDREPGVMGFTRM